VRGPHNIWRLIRTGATFERTGAMSAALAALDAPPALRVAARASSIGNGGSLSCKTLSSSASSGPTTSGRVDSNWPNLM